MMDLMWFLATMLLAQDASVIRVPVRLVAAPTLVFSKGNRLIPGLKKADFRVFDNGIPQTVNLDAEPAPVSVVIAIQTNLDVRSSISFISKVGSVMDAHLVGATGRAAVICYGKDIKVLKPFGSGDVREAFRGISAHGVEARMIDAGLRAIDLLKTRPRDNARVLLFVGQMADHGSESNWATLQAEAELENVSIYSLSSSAGTNTSGSPTNKDLGWLTSLLSRHDLSPLIAATGGTELHFHRQHELEDAIGTMGVELRSTYMLTYYPSSAAAGKHSISVEVSVPGAKTYTRPGYMLSPN